MPLLHIAFVMATIMLMKTLIEEKILWAGQKCIYVASVASHSCTIVLYSVRLFADIIS